VCQVIEVLVSTLSSDTQRSQCVPVTANLLLYIAELCATVKLQVVPLLPRLMPAVIQVTTDLPLFMKFVLMIYITIVTFGTLLFDCVILISKL